MFNLLDDVQDNYQTGWDNTIAEGQIFSTAQQWIIAIVIFAVIVTILSTIITYCFYGLTKKNNKIMKCAIIILGIGITIVFVILGITACKAID